MSGKDNDTTPVWAPQVTLDLDTASDKAFQDTILKFKSLASTSMTPLGPLGLKTGWYTVTPEMAEDFLRRNEANRKVSLPTVRKYAYSMLTDDWRKTGQPLIFNSDGKAEDLQHRCWACYLSGASFDTYIITDVEPQVDLFAYIDDVKPRSAADALYTSGLDGASGALAKATQLAWRYDHGVLGIVHQTRIRALTSREVLHFVKDNPELLAAAHLLTANFPTALKAIGDLPVAAFFSWRASNVVGAEVVEQFFIALSDENKLADESPVMGLISRFQRDQGVKEIKEPLRLALVIRAFSMFVDGKKMPKTHRELSLRENEKFPRIEEIASRVAQAA